MSQKEIISTILIRNKLFSGKGPDFYIEKQPFPLISSFLVLFQENSSVSTPRFLFLMVKSLTGWAETLTIQVVMQSVTQRSQEGMESRKEEFLKSVSQIYLVAILVVLPLYYIPWNGYYKLGDTKYYLYRNISLLCMGICLLVGLLAALSRWHAGKNHRSGKTLRETMKKLFMKCREHSVATAVCLYALVAVFSAVCSPYGATAWSGEREWYMGAITLCLMAGGFLLAARYGEQCRQVLLLGEAAFVAVTAIGLLQKLGYDPLGLLKGYVVGDWEYTHMLSTLGNSNWLSGYYSVMFPFSLSLFQQAIVEKKAIGKIAGGICNMLAVMLLLLQGSDGGVIVAGAAIGLCFWAGREHLESWESYLLLLAISAVGMRIWGIWMKNLGTFDILLQDGVAKKLASWKGWMPFALLCLVFCGIYHRVTEKKKKTLQKWTFVGVAVAAVAIVIWYLYRVSGINFAEWGNRRGRLWQMAWTGFREGNLHQKLLGAGPDCFAEYLGELLPGGTVLFDKGYFNGSIFTNAHNEWFTTLINMGLLGVAAYAGVFITALRTYKKNFLAVVLLLTYGIHSLISFQQVLNAPFFFLVLGLCEAYDRRKTIRTDRYEESTEVI